MSTTEARVGNWGCTASGRRYWPEDPRPEDIAIEDIAHALALQCRYGGHCSEFYSVAQHAVHVSEVCDPADALWGLLHDASEAYIVDVPRPFKLAAGMEVYREFEERSMRAICDRFGLPYEMPESVRDADETLLATEARDLMPHHGEAGVPLWALSHYPMKWCVYPWTWREAEALFLRRFRELTAGGA
jgi:uncharacterized protein